VARAQPNLLVNITNDAWFGPTAEPELHLRLSALRAIESRLDLVRAVNLGIPAWIDATGSVRRRGSTDSESVMLVSPTLNEMSPTLYTKAGDIPLLVLLFAVTLAAALRARKRSSEITGPDP
jgi:apolipoprotein N-acyltransferase